MLCTAAVAQGAVQLRLGSERSGPAASVERRCSYYLAFSSVTVLIGSTGSIMSALASAAPQCFVCLEGQILARADQQLCFDQESKALSTLTSSLCSTRTWFFE